MNTFILVMLASLTAAAITTTGILVISRFEEWAKKNAIYFISFAAGMILTVSLVHLIPESLEMLPTAAPFMVLGFMTLYLSGHILQRTVKVQQPEALRIGIIPLIGIGFHSLVDGLIFSVTFETSVFTGLLAAAGMILHEFPEGVFTYVLLKRGGFDHRKSILLAFLVAALTTPVGTLISFPFIHEIEVEVLGGLLAFSAGALVYVAASHLVPEIEERWQKGALYPIFAGIAIGLLILLTGQG